MSVLCERPDSEFFRTIPDFCVAVQKFTENDVKSKLEHFGRIFERHGVAEEFGLAMVHRHFDISKDEVLVETLNDQKSIGVTSPWIIKDTTVVAPDNETLWIEHDTKMKQYVVPQTWSFDKHGNLKPLEFLSTDSPMQTPDESFAAELYSELKNLGLEGILGIRRIVNVKGRSSWETTPHNSRSNVVVFGTRPKADVAKKMFTVLWCFDENGKLRAGADCRGHCRGHCNGHD
ncbi:uncharacterized protein LOC119067365 [Bradysia coprophila]|uniref:uncharacterized protein LOC119067364 n=1 Tax=Bradysia coprophila TaxID=38358 RepID=UPI00187DCE78|nr:uncharacterized protein LOC119067364 [Bradysia coprophila]XP_037026175.1 uncharacterized protein LOC119067365 [Bradysia coprophila]